MADSNGLNSDLLQMISADDEDKGSSQFDSFRLRFVVVRSIPILIALLLASLSIAYLYLRYTRPIYQSSSVLKVDIQSNAGVLGIGNATKSDNSNSLSGEIEVLKSAKLFKKVVQQMDLDVSYFHEGKILFEEKYRNSPIFIEFEPDEKGIIYNTKIYCELISDNKINIYLKDGSNDIDYHIYTEFGKEVTLKNFKFKIYQTRYFSKANIGSKYFIIINSPEAIQGFLARNLRAEIANAKANTIRISFSDYHPLKAQEIVDSVTNIYLRLTLDKKRKAQEKTLQYIEGQIKNRKKKLDEADAKLRAFLAKPELPSSKADFPRLLSKKESLNETLLDYKDKIYEFDSVSNDLESLDSIKAAIKILKDLDPKEDYLVDQLDETFKFLIKKFKHRGLGSAAGKLQELEKLSRDFEQLKLTTKPTAFSYHKAQTEINELKKEVIDVVLFEFRQLERKRNLLERKLKYLDDQISDIEANILKIPTRDSKRRKLERDYKLQENFFVLLNNRSIEYEIARAGTVQDYDVLSGASKATEPISPVKFQIYIFAVGGWIFLSLIVLVTRYMLKNTIINQEEIERKINVPFLGSVPVFRRKKMDVSELVVDAHPKSAVTEAMRSIRTNIDFIIPKKKTKMLSVTSSVSGEGKTFIALNLGGVIALSAKKVVIVDLDLRKPKIHLGFGAENINGISNILIGKATIDECLQKSEIEGLHYICAGPTPPNPSELLMMQSFEEMVSELKEKYDVIIIDSPPVGLVTDGMILMKKVDLPIYVVRSDYTRRGVEKNINKLKSFNKIENLSIILNSVSKFNSSRSGYGSYGYGYGYGYYDEESHMGKRLWKRIFK